MVGSKRETKSGGRSLLNFCPSINVRKADWTFVFNEKRGNGRSALEKSFSFILQNFPSSCFVINNSDYALK